MKFYILFLVLMIFNLQALATDMSGCELVSGSSGYVSYNNDLRFRSQFVSEKCWIITLPANSILLLKFENLKISRSSGRVTVSEMKTNGTPKQTVYNSTNNYRLPETFVMFHNVKVDLSRSNYDDVSFSLKFTTESLTCHTEGAFRCSDNKCIPSEKVCDGVPDCKDEEDEKSCEIGVLSVENVRESRLNASVWLEESSVAAWKNNLHRIIVALYLSGKVDFSSKNTSDKHILLLKQLELSAAIGFLRNSTEPVSPNQLSMLINALLVTCRNPRQFYGFNLVQFLKDSIAHSTNTIQLVAHLALCNAHEALPKNSLDQLLEDLDDESEDIYMPEVQAFTVMAISCILKNGQKDALNETSLEIYEKIVKNFKKSQNDDGSFGNVYTTALITQALLSKGEENSKDWNVKACIKFLIKQLNPTDYLSLYYILPILNRKSLADIAIVNCSEAGRSAEEKDIEYISYKLESKVQVQYSLCLGTKKDVIHTIYLSVPEKTNAYEVMKLAASADPKYKFHSKSISGKIYVYEINNFTNDPEADLFWLTYVENKLNNRTIHHLKPSPDKIALYENDHLILWYRSAEF